jgi:preprotein translocase subunit SecF
MINFLKYKRAFFLFSLLFLLPSVYFLATKGLNPSVDFTGGTLLEIEFSQEAVITREQLSAALEAHLDINSLVQTNPHTFIVRAALIDQQTNTQLQQQLVSQFGLLTEKRFETIGPTLGKELIKKTIFGVLLATSFILFYVAVRFKDKKYGICAILAMLHDTIIVMGAFSVATVYFGAQADALFVTALLTILSFSVHDTIVVYDRIRERVANYPDLDYVTVVNQAITETLGRSINNSLTIIFMLLSLFLLGGETIRWFVFALLVGTVSGTYSSTFTAAPLLVVWDSLSRSRLSRSRNVIF